MAFEFGREFGPVETPSSRIGAGFAEGLKTHLANTMERLQKSDEQRNQQSRIAHALTSVGIDPVKASAVAQLPHEFQQQFFKQHFAQPGQEAYSNALSSIRSGKEPSPEDMQRLSEGQLTNIARILQSEEQKKATQQNAEESRELRKLAQEESHRKNISAEEQKQQAQIEKTNAPYLKESNRITPLAQEAFDLALQLRDLDQPGALESGLFFGTIKKPTTYLNPASQQYLAKTKDLVDLLAANTGAASKYKLQIKEESKPSLSQAREARMGLVGDLLHKTGGILLKNNIKDALIERHGRQPANIDKEINKYYAKIHPLLKKTALGTVIEEDELGIKLVNRGQYWEPLPYEGEI